MKKMNETFTQEQLKKWEIVDYSFTDVAIPQTLDHYNQWVKEKKHLPLTYLDGIRKEKRQSLNEHWIEFKSAVVFLFSYHKTHQALHNFYKKNSLWNKLKIASYTLGFDGMDYHHVLKNRLEEIGEFLKENHVGLEYKITLDTHPVLERDLAMRSGLGWFGKNSMLINRKHGSFLIIGSLLLNQEIKEDKMKIETDHCGQCTRCVDACPTEAIDPATRTITAKDCISTFTIEQFKLDTIPSEKMTLKDGFIFGCDICQDVCPWNKRIDRQSVSTDDAFTNPLQNKILSFFLFKKPIELSNELQSLSEGQFKKIFSGTSFERSGKRGILKNIRYYLKENGDQ